MDLNNLDIDSFLFIALVAGLVCVISTVLYLTFVKTAVLHPIPIPLLLDNGNGKKKKKKPDPKKTKKRTKPPQGQVGDNELDKSQSSDESQSLAAPIPDDRCKEETDMKLSQVEDFLSLRPMNVLHSEPQVPTIHELASPESPVEAVSSLLQDDSMPSSLESPVPLHSDAAEPETVMSTQKSKKGKRKQIKRDVITPSDAFGTESTHPKKSKNELGDQTSRLPTVPVVSPTEDFVHQEQLKKLTEKLQQNEQTIQKLSTKSSELSEENQRLREQEEKNSLGYRVLQQQFTELLKSNKTLEHDKNQKELRLKTLSDEKKAILNQLDQVTADATRRKEEMDKEVRRLQEQVMEAQSKLTVLTNTPPTSSPELIHAKEFAQIMSNENHMLNTKLEQRENDLRQLRQASLIQQQEVQRLRAEKLKLLSDHENLLEEVRMKQQAQKAEASNRIANFETELQRHCREFEAEKKDLLGKLSDTRAELCRCLEQEKQMREVISSMEYQFAELRAEKEMLESRVSSNESEQVGGKSEELVCEITNLTNELTVTKASLAQAQAHAESLVGELEALKANSNRQTTPDENKHKNQSRKELENLRSQLDTVQQQLDSSLSAARDAKQAEDAARLEGEQYKAALVETEELLAKLERSVEAAEENWCSLLAKSEAECRKLKAQLARKDKRTAEKAKNVSSTSLSNMHTQDAAPIPQDASSKDVDSDFDAVLVDGEDYVSDAWESTVKLNEPLSN